MSTEHLDSDMESLLEAFQRQMREVVEVQQRRVLLTANATSRDKRITVTVNADGLLIDVQFTSDIAELDYDEIASAIRDLTQEAAAAVARETQALIEPLTARQTRLPKVSEVIEGMPDFETGLPLRLPVSTAAPGAPERRELAAQATAMTFADVEELDGDHLRDIGSIRQAW
ncbi:YbaB/EbfC family nucleoid-associated protein [Nocardia sp. NPDC052566]|uniref:YbaB/EbfC family nucleoid-associated protein n=1 Tax=Nocardia sp. NPDC052566 TaxID=3364330 RepID=UPI0037C6C060